MNIAGERRGIYEVFGHRFIQVTGTVNDLLSRLWYGYHVRFITYNYYLFKDDEKLTHNTKKIKIFRMSERRRYLTDEEAACDGEWEGFGTSSTGLLYDFEQMEEMFDEVYREQSARLEQHFHHRHARSEALLRDARRGVEDFSELFKEETLWAREVFPNLIKNRNQPNDKLPISNESQEVDLDIVRWETEGYMIIQSPPNISPEESSE
jgi:hypothetical protein